MDSYLIYKPYRMLSQFTNEIPEHYTLADLDYNFPRDVYPVGRLDADSEGLLLLTNDKSLNAQLLSPKNKKPKTYWAQVEGAPSIQDLHPITQGLTIKIKRKPYQTLPAEVNIIPAPNLPERDPPIRYRKAIPTTWLSLTLIEGKNRQVRKMCAAVGYPVLRLVRAGFDQWSLTDPHWSMMKPGDVVRV